MGLKEAKLIEVGGQIEIIEECKRQKRKWVRRRERSIDTKRQRGKIEMKRDKDRQRKYSI